MNKSTVPVWYIGFNYDETVRVYAVRAVTVEVANLKLQAFLEKPQRAISISPEKMVILTDDEAKELRHSRRTPIRYNTEGIAFISKNHRAVAI